ncbi:MAG: hypothetical protein U0Q55_16695 [Vicinamibacterales bacterium]
MYLNQRATLQCVHGGTVMIIPMPMRSMHVMDSPVLTDQDLLKAFIIGCPQIGPGLKPCTKIVQIILGRSMQIDVDGETPILESLMALTDGVAPGIVRAVNNGQSNATPTLPMPQMITATNAAGSGSGFCEPCARAAAARAEAARAAEEAAANQRWAEAKAALQQPTPTPGAGSGRVAAAGTPVHTAPAPKGPETTAGPYKSGLGDRADKIINQSPTLRTNLEQLQKNGWTIRLGAAGKGTFADRAKKVITVDANDKGSPATLAQSLAHESGHALYQKDPYVPPAGLTRDEYVSRNVNASLKDEGEATLMNIDVRDEIRKNGGPDIGIAGTQGREYQRIARKYPDAKDRDKARREIGTVFADTEHPSNDTTKTYKDYYSKPFADHYDRTTTAPKRKL